MAKVEQKKGVLRSSALAKSSKTGARTAWILHHGFISPGQGALTGAGPPHGTPPVGSLPFSFALRRESYLASVGKDNPK